MIGRPGECRERRGRFGEELGRGGVRKCPPEMVERMTRMQANSEFFLAHLLPAIIGYTPTLPRCRRPGRGSSWGPGTAPRARCPTWPHWRWPSGSASPSPLPQESPALRNPPRAIRPKLSTTYSTAANSAEMFASPQKTASPGHWAYARRPTRAAAIDGSREPRWGSAAGAPASSYTGPARGTRTAARTVPVMTWIASWPDRRVRRTGSARFRTIKEVPS